jgi:hypothetical protein
MRRVSVASRRVSASASLLPPALPPAPPPAALLAPLPSLLRAPLPAPPTGSLTSATALATSSVAQITTWSTAPAVAAAAQARRCSSSGVGAGAWAAGGGCGWWRRGGARATGRLRPCTAPPPPPPPAAPTCCACGAGPAAGTAASRGPAGAAAWERGSRRSGWVAGARGRAVRAKRAAVKTWECRASGRGGGAWSAQTNRRAGAHRGRRDACQRRASCRAFTRLPRLSNPGPSTAPTCCGCRCGGGRAALPPGTASVRARWAPAPAAALGGEEWGGGRVRGCVRAWNRRGGGGRGGGQRGGKRVTRAPEPGRPRAPWWPPAAGPQPRLHRLPRLSNPGPPPRAHLLLLELVLPLHLVLYQLLQLVLVLLLQMLLLQLVLLLQVL